MDVKSANNHGNPLSMDGKLAKTMEILYQWMES